MKCRLLMMQRMIISLSNLTVLCIPNDIIIRKKLENTNIKTVRIIECLVSKY